MEGIDAIKDEDVELSLIQDVPHSFVKGNLIMPLRKKDGVLFAAVADEKGILALLELSKHLGLKPLPLSAPPGVIIDAINRFYGQMGSAEEVMDNITGEDLSSVATEFEKPRDILELTEEAPIIRLLNALLQQAVKERASDIHIEPYEKELDVRLRVDGILHRVLSPPKIIQDALISRVKIMANLDIAEKRLPQDGRIRLLIGGKDIDIRVSIIPTSFGERAVLRLLDRKQGLIGLWEVGFNKDDESRLEDLLKRTNGILLVTGPTGSGKTTTLYAALNRIHTEEKNIITVEDPVEYQLKGIGQIHVNPKIGLTFASGLRSILRQDPDVIMVGEIRDFETAEIAIQASLTGHLVLSTLHTNDAPSAITRLIDMGVEPFLVASSLMGILAQRLVRVICPYCKESYEPSDAERAYFLNLSPTHYSLLYRGRGCDRCKDKGYIGRTGIFELLIIDNEIRHMITGKIDSQSIKNVAISRGMKTLMSDGVEKVLQGVTTLEEVLRVTQKDYADISL
ncbi:MAG: type II secretion system ATPase GspE [Nitrospirota bacterium]|nr:type II secretion system ATPase GspE [Nitrospirota bacterium]MDH5768040.1 type II secretion system ATPase GspE [Nitrospirota bacterium]